MLLTSVSASFAAGMHAINDKQVGVREREKDECKLIKSDYVKLKSQMDTFSFSAVPDVELFDTRVKLNIIHVYSKWK